MLYYRDYNLSKLNDNIASESHELNNKLSLLNSINKFQRELTALDRKVIISQDDYFSLNETVSLVREIAAIADIYKIKLNDFKLDIPKYIDCKERANGPGPFSVPFEGKFEGNYIAAGKFVNALEEKIYIGEIYSIRLTNSETNLSGITFNIKGIVRFIDRYNLELAKSE